MKRGDIVQLGRHRLMCGDCTDQEEVTRLLGGCIPQLVFSSPPYLMQRNYGHQAPCWTSMMTKAIRSAQVSQNTQLLINLGLIYKNGEWQEYWADWMSNLQQMGWRKFGWYVWDKLEAIPGNRHGRLGPSFEFIFHFNKQGRQANKVVPCKHAGYFHRQKAKGGFAGGSWKKGQGNICSSYKIMDATIRASPEKQSRLHGGHPAMFPVSIPTSAIESWTNPGEAIYDPFAGSGTSGIAADNCGRSSFLMEIIPDYCDMIIERYRKHIERKISPSKSKGRVVA